MLRLFKTHEIMFASKQRFHERGKQFVLSLRLNALLKNRYYSAQIHRVMRLLERDIVYYVDDLFRHIINDKMSSAQDDRKVRVVLTLICIATDTALLVGCQRKRQ